MGRGRRWPPRRQCVPRSSLGVTSLCDGLSAVSPSWRERAGSVRLVMSFPSVCTLAHWKPGHSWRELQTATLERALLRLSLCSQVFQSSGLLHPPSLDLSSMPFGAHTLSFPFFFWNLLNAELRAVLHLWCCLAEEPGFQDRCGRSPASLQGWKRFPLT